MDLDMSLTMTPDVQLLRLEELRLNGENPKRPMSKKHGTGLKRSLDTFGFCGAILVVPHPDEDGYIILDGNTRFEELRERKAEQVPCIVLEHIDTWEKIRKFVITYDRNMKLFDETKVVQQLQELVEAGEDIQVLAELSAIDNLEDVLAKAVEGAAEEIPQEEEIPEGEAWGSFVVSGPYVEVENIQLHMRTIKGKLKPIQKVQAIFAAMADMPIDDPELGNENLFFALLAAASHMGPAARKIVIPLISADQERVIMQKLHEFVEAEEIPGEFALSRALEYMLADYEIGGPGREG